MGYSIAEQQCCRRYPGSCTLPGVTEDIVIYTAYAYILARSFPIGLDQGRTDSIHILAHLVLCTGTRL